MENAQAGLHQFRQIKTNLSGKRNLIQIKLHLYIQANLQFSYIFGVMKSLSIKHSINSSEIKHFTSISIRPIPMTSYLRMMGTGSVRPEGKETESGLGKCLRMGQVASSKTACF